MSAEARIMLDRGAKFELEFGVLGQIDSYGGVNFPTNAEVSEALMTAPVSSSYRQGVGSHGNDRCVLAPNLIS